MKLIKSIIGICVSIIILLLIIFKFLDLYTNKNKLVLVPNVTGKKMNELSSLLATDLRYVVSDSMYDKNKKRGIILNQNPKPTTEVKPGRTIYLTINKTTPVLVTVPEVMDESLQMAKEKLINAGFEIGRIDTIASEFPIILEVSFGGQKIFKGEKLFEGSKIDLKIGQGTKSNLE